MFFSKNATAPDPQQQRRRATDQPLTLARERSWYARPASFTDLLPWVDYLPETRSFLLQDGKSTGVIIDLEPIPCESRSMQDMADLHNKVQKALVHTVLPGDPPYVMQMYIGPETPHALLTAIEAHTDAALRDSDFNHWFMAEYRNHLDRLTADGGAFIDDLVSGEPWRAQDTRVRLALYRWLPRNWPQANIVPTQRELDVAAGRLTKSLSAIGIRATRLDRRGLHHWLLPWFNPAPPVADQDPDALLARFPCPDPAPAAGKAPFSAEDPSEALVLGMPVSDPDSGCWWFDGLPSTVVTAHRLIAAPAIGHLSAERSMGDRSVAFSDRLPPGAVACLTVTLQSRDATDRHLMENAKYAVGDSPEATQARDAITQVQHRTAAGDPLYPTSLSFYLRAPDIPALRAQEEQLAALLLSENLQPLNREHDHIRVDTFIRQLPCNYNPALESDLRRARYTYASHVAAMAPLYGRSRGTGTPGFVGFNRGGGSVMFDPVADRQQNAHMLIFGPTGAGKSSTGVSMLLHQIAVRRPRLFIVDYGESFRLFGDHCERLGLSVNRLLMTPASDVSLPPFAEATRLAGALAPEGEDPDPGAWSLDADGTSPPDEQKRDLLGEMEIAARLMITGGEAREEANMTRADRRLIQRAIIQAGRTCRTTGRQVLTEDVAAALTTLPGLSPSRQERAEEMSDSMGLYTEDFTGRIFNRPGNPWPDVDVTIVDLGAFANQGAEDKLALTLMGLTNHVTAMAEVNQHGSSDRETLFVIDEAHKITTHPLISPYLTTASKTWRKLGIWLWLLTQNLEDFPELARRMLNMLEWWLCLAPPPDEIKQLARFRELTPEQTSQLQDTVKNPGKYVEAVLLRGSKSHPLRIVPPAVCFALAQTELNEKTARRRIMQELGCSELDAAYEIARRMRETPA